MSWLTFKRQKLWVIVLAFASMFISLEVRANWETVIQSQINSLLNWETKIGGWISAPESAYLSLQVQTDVLDPDSSLIGNKFQQIRWNPADPALFAVSNSTAKSVELWQYNGLTMAPSQLSSDTTLGAVTAPTLAWSSPVFVRLAVGYSPGGSAGNVNFYDSTLNLQANAAISALSAPVTAIAWSQDSEYVAVAYGQYVDVYEYSDIDTGSPLYTYDSGSSNNVVNSISWNTGAYPSLIVVGYSDSITAAQYLDIFDSGNGLTVLSSVVTYNSGAGNTPLTVAWDPTGNYLVAAGYSPGGQGVLYAYTPPGGSPATLLAVPNTTADFGVASNGFCDLAWNPKINTDGTYSLILASSPSSAGGDGYLWYTWDGNDQTLTLQNNTNAYISNSSYSTAWISDGSGFAVTGESLLGSSNFVLNAAGSYVSPALLRTTSNWVNANDVVLRMTSNWVHANDSLFRTTSNAVNSATLDAEVLHGTSRWVVNNSESILGTSNWVNANAMLLRATSNAVANSSIAVASIDAILDWVVTQEKPYKGLQVQADTLSSGDLFQQIRCNPVDPTLFAVSNGTANSVQLWQYNGLTAQPTMIAQDASLESAPTLAWNNLGTRLAVGYGSSVNFYDASLVAQVATISVSDPVASLSWSPDGSYVAVAYGTFVDIYSYNDSGAVSAVAMAKNYGSGSLVDSISWNPRNNSSLLAVGYVNPSGTVNLDILDFNNGSGGALASALATPAVYTSTWHAVIAWDPSGNDIAIAGYGLNCQGAIYHYQSGASNTLTFVATIDYSGDSNDGFYDLSWNPVVNADGTYSLLFDVQSSTSGNGYLWATWNGTSLTQQDILSNLNPRTASSVAWICDGSGFVVTGQSLIGTANFILNAAGYAPSSVLLRATSNAVAANHDLLQTTRTSLNVAESQIEAVLDWTVIQEKPNKGIQVQADTLSSGDLFRQIAWNPNPVHSNLFAVSDETTESVQLWQYNGLVDKPTEIASESFISAGGVPRALAWTHDGSSLAVGNDNGVVLYDTTLAGVGGGGNESVSGIAWSPDDSLCAWAYGESVMVNAYNSGSFPSFGVPENYGAGYAVNSVSWNPLNGSTLLAVGYTDNNGNPYVDILNYDAGTESLESALDTPEAYGPESQPIVAVSWDPTGNFIAAAGYAANGQGMIYQYASEPETLTPVETVNLSSSASDGFDGLSWNQIANDDGSYSLLFDVDTSSGDGYRWYTWNGNTLTLRDESTSLTPYESWSSAWISDASGFAIVGKDLIGSANFVLNAAGSCPSSALLRATSNWVNANDSVLRTTSNAVNSITVGSFSDRDRETLDGTSAWVVNNDSWIRGTSNWVNANDFLLRSTSNVSISSSLAVNQLSYATAALIRVKGGQWSSNYPKPQPRSGQLFLLPQPDQSFLDLPKELRSFSPAQAEATYGNNTIIELAENTVLSGNICCTGNVTIRGMGVKLDFAGYSISIAADGDIPGTITIEGVELENVDTASLIVGTNAGTVVLRDVVLNLAQGKAVNFSTGYLVVGGQLLMRGKGVFVYASSKLMSINKDCSLTIDTDASFFYLPVGATSEQLFHAEPGTERVVLMAMPLGQPVIR